jgi:hydroxylamine reductase (hybrid-cluster protein)
MKSSLHFKGHYGTAWHNQKKVPWLPGPVLLTSNCLVEPLQF